MLLPHGTLVAVIDGKNFALFNNTGNEAEPELSEVTAPKLDTSNHSGGSRRSVPGNHADTQVAEDSHAIAATEWLNAQVLGHKLEHLVLIAPPRTIGEMRLHYHKELQRVLLGEITKDLSGRPGTEVLAALQAK
jgi:protein required for attachment to host cells